MCHVVVHLKLYLAVKTCCQQDDFFIFYFIIMSWYVKPKN